MCTSILANFLLVQWAKCLTGVKYDRVYLSIGDISVNALVDTDRAYSLLERPYDRCYTSRRIFPSAASHSYVADDMLLEKRWCQGQAK